MRRILFLLFLLMLTVTVSGQTHKVTRKPKTSAVVPKPKPKPSTPVAKSKPAKPVVKPSTPIVESQDQKKLQLNPIIEKLLANMVYVEGGTFTMDDSPEQGFYPWDSPKNVYQVTLSSYYIGKYEVTQEEWEAVMGSNPSHFKGSHLPVECVSWNDCQEFIKKLNALTDQNFRLPTEAEWEFAARGGNKSRGTKFAGGSDISSVYQGDGEFDTFFSLLMTLKPTAESLDSCLIPAPFCKTEMRILSLSCLGRDEILSMDIPWHSSNNISVTSKSVCGSQARF